MSSHVLSKFSSKNFIVSGLTFRPLIHFQFIFVYGVRKCCNFLLLHVSSPVFPAPFIKEVVFIPLYILAFSVKNKVPIGAWVYLWAFYLVPLVYISVFVPVQNGTFVLMIVALQYNLKSGRLIPPAPFFFLKTALAIQGLLCFHMNCEIFWFQFYEKCH